MSNNDQKGKVLKLSKREAAVTPMDLGHRVKQIRLSQNLTLEQASQLTGLARSTLSKIENEQISPTFAVVQKLVAGLKIDIPQLFESPTKKKNSPSGRRDITLAGQGLPHPTPTYEHELLANQLSNKKMIPYRTKVCARSFEDYSDWIRHDGEEFLYVLAGEVRLFTEFYAPVDLKVGDSAYYDCDMGHMVISVSEEDAEILWVTD